MGQGEERGYEEENVGDSDDADDADDNDDTDDVDDSEESRNSEAAAAKGEHSHHRDHDKDGRDHDDARGRHRDEDDEDDADEQDEEQARGGKGKHFKGKHCALIAGAVILAVYLVLLFMAYKLYKAARRFEQLAQRGNVPIAPVFAQQPVLAYAPGMFPGNIPMGAPVQ
jgi:hypothetical protein